ncbi:MAG: peptide-N-glycosidase F-related protein, partial [Flavobacteriales bacterium]
SVELEAGNWQELLDLKFQFITGTPAREVKRVERIWDRDLALSNFDNVIVPKTLGKNSGEAGWKMLATTTGHQFDNPFNCAEFCNNMHSVEVNGQEQWSWEIMQECADNPLYPQGGTWIFDRAGWCPGMNSTTREFELTPFVSAQDSFVVDYDITYNDYGNYVFFGTLIGYGEPNHAHDAEIDLITAPSNWKIHSRWNPICEEARFVLRNKGAQPLTSATILNHVENGPVDTLHWTGDLNFMQREEVVLPYHHPDFWSGDDNTLKAFHIDVLTENGADENTTNNAAVSYFYPPTTYQYTDLSENRIIIQLRTNNLPGESSYTLYNSNNDVVFTRSNFNEANTTYRDTVAIDAGCYRFHLIDSDDDGLS